MTDTNQYLTEKNNSHHALQGQNVRALRIRQNLTLAQLSEQTDISKSHLSRFERGEKTVSVDALIRIAKALQVSVSTLLGEASPQDVIHVVRAAEQKIRTGTNETYEFSSLSRSDIANGPSVFKVLLSTASKLSEKAHHSGEEFIYVLDGSLEIIFPTHTVILRTGDYVQFPGFIQHSICGLVDNTELLIAITPHD